MILLSFMIVIFSCVDKTEFDFKKLSLENVNPGWAMPLVSDSIGLKSGEYIDFEGENAVLVLNQKFDDFNLNELDSLFNLPHQDLNWNYALTIPKFQNGVLTLNLSYLGMYPLALPDMGKIDASQIRIDSIFVSDLDMSIKPLIVSDMTGNITTSILSLQKNNTPFVFNLPFPTKELNYHYNDYILRLSEDSINGYNQLSFKFDMNFKGSFKDLAGKEAQIGCEAQLKKLKLSKIFAYFGHQVINIQDTFSIDIKGLTGNVQIKNIDLKFEVNNSIGIPVGLNINLIGLTTYKGDMKVVSGFNPIYIKAGDIHQFPNPVKTIDSISSSKLTPLLGDFPNKFYYNLNLETNSNKIRPHYNNFLIPGNQVSLVAHVRAPLNISIQDVVFTDTITFDFDSDWRKMIDDLYFRLKVINRFPINIYFQSKLLDENGKFIDYLFDDPLVINAGVNNSTSNEVINNTVLQRDIPFNKFKLDHLQQTRKIVFEVKANTSGNGANKVQIKRKDFVVFKLGVASTIHLNEVL